jgi:glycosyltransferase involved in cell wall biosynthesis
MKVAVIAEGERHDPRNFVGPIRLFDPLDAVAKRHAIEWACIGPGDPFDDADVVIMQRTPFETIDAINDAADRFARSKKPLLWEIDDHLFCEDLRALIEQGAIDQIDEDAFALGEAHRTLLPLASGFVCSTERLADSLHTLRPSASVHVIPVALDFDHPRWNVPTARRTDDITIGWSGGSRVGRDFEIVTGALQRVLERNRHIRFVLGGSEHYAPLFAHLPRFSTIGWVPYDEYPRLISQLDAVVIPMENHAYNQCKSGLKVIDHAAVGVPSVCSPLLPFASVDESVATFAVSEDDWVSGIEKAVALDAEARASLRMHTRERHHIRRIVGKWWDVLRRYA